MYKNLRKSYKFVLFCCMFLVFAMFSYIFKPFLLATGSQPGGFSEISSGNSYTKTWILKGVVQGLGRVPSPCTPPFKIQIFV